jgi:ectoine hydroxylase-related dioxygenase (phytanoyl-CoA dioxygenase family)
VGRLHPWNERFAWHDHAGPYRALSDDQVRQFDELGYVVVDDLVAPDRLAELVGEIDRFEAETEAFLRTLDGEKLSIAEAGAITFTVHLVARSAVCRALVHDPRIVDIAVDLLGPDVRLYWDQAVYKKPEKPRRFPWHQDNGYTFVEPQQYLTVWLALTDATEDNGCPHVVPGLHREGTLAHRYVDDLGYECLQDPPGAVAAPVRAGGAVVFSSLTPHLTGPNVTGATRKAYIIQYIPDGAERCEGDASAGPPTARVRCDDERRQFVVAGTGRTS